MRLEPTLNRALHTRPLRQVVLLIILSLVSCNSIPIANEVNQNQANEIVAALHSNGISAIASQERGSKAKYSVQIKKSYYPQAVALLHARGLLGEPKASFTELTSPKGILPNSREMETLRLYHANATEIEEVLLNNPAVQSAKVLVRPDFGAGSTGREVGGVSVVLQERAGFSIDTNEILQIVMHAVPGVPKEKILIPPPHKAPKTQLIDSREGVLNDNGRVVRVPLAPFLFQWRVAEGDYTSLALTLLCCMLIVFGVGGLIGYWYGLFQRTGDGTIIEHEHRTITEEKPTAQELLE